MKSNIQGKIGWFYDSLGKTQFNIEKISEAIIERNYIIFCFSLNWVKIKYKSMLMEWANNNSKCPDALLVNMHGTQIIYSTAKFGIGSIFGIELTKCTMNSSCFSFIIITEMLAHE